MKLLYLFLINIVLLHHLMSILILVSIHYPF